MPQITLLFAILLMALGGLMYAMTSAVTSLIPAFFGIVLFTLGAVAFIPGTRKHVIHAACGIALVGLIMPGYMAIKSIVASFSGAEMRPMAVATQAGMAVLCGVLLAMYVRSFIHARKRRREEALKA